MEPTLITVGLTDNGVLVRVDPCMFDDVPWEEFRTNAVNVVYNAVRNYNDKWPINSIGDLLRIQAAKFKSIKGNGRKRWEYFRNDLSEFCYANLQAMAAKAAHTIEWSGLSDA